MTAAAAARIMRVPCAVCGSTLGCGHQAIPDAVVELEQSVLRLRQEAHEAESAAAAWRERAKRAETEVEQLRGFARRVMEVWPHGDLDGGELQEVAVAAGLLRPEERCTPCGENCGCAEFYAADEISDGFTCYRRVPWLLDQHPAPVVNHVLP